MRLIAFAVRFGGRRHILTLLLKRRTHYIPTESSNRQQDGLLAERSNARVSRINTSLVACAFPSRKRRGFESHRGQLFNFFALHLPSFYSCDFVLARFQTSFFFLDRKNLHLLLQLIYSFLCATRMEVSTSGPTYSAARSPSPGSVSFRSAQVALPETTSFYQQNIDASRTSLSERRFHAVNQLHRDANSRSRTSISSTSGGNNTIAVDDEIAQGLAEEVGGAENDDKVDKSSEYNGFLPNRNKNRTHSILPSAAFFAPKKPPQSQLPRSPLSPLPPVASNHPLNPSTDNLDVGPVFRRGEPGPLDVNGRETTGMMMRGRDGSLDAASSFALGGGSSSSEGDHGARTSTNLDQSTIDAYRQGAGTVKSKASRDPLLNHSTSNGNVKQSYWDQSAAKRRSVTKAAKTSSSSADPNRLSKQERRERIRRYKIHKGSNRFFLFGLIMTSDDNPFPFLASLVVMFALPILWFIFVAPFTWHHISPAAVIIFAYVWAIGASSMWYVELAEKLVLREGC